MNIKKNILRPKLIFFLTLLVLFFVILYIKKSALVKTIEIDKDIQVYYRNNGKLKGKFIFSLESYRPVNNLERSYLLIMSDDGKILYKSASVSSSDHKYVKYNFSQLDSNTYASFGGTFHDLMTNRASLYLMNRDFEEIHNITTPKEEPDLDGREVRKTDDNHMFFLFERRKLSGDIYDNEIQERDIDGNIVFRWSAKEAYAKFFPNFKLEDINPFDLNSFFIDKDKNLLISFKRTNEIIKIEYPSGKILFRINNEGDWKILNDPFSGFKQQHHVQVLPNGNIIMFDNGDKVRPSRAVEYKIDESKKTLEHVWEYRLPGNASVRPNEGSVQRLSNGNTLIGWGRPLNEQIERDTIFSEVTSKGDIVRELTTDKSAALYRVYFEEEK